jgi:hypothetical protein
MKKLLLTALLAALPLTGFAQPANDNCSGAINLTVNPSPANTATVTGNFNGATTGTIWGFCFSNLYNDLWYTFTATHTMQQVNVTNLTQMAYLSYEVLLGSCSGTTLGCGSATPENTGGLFTGLVPGQQYYIHIVSPAATMPATAAFTLGITSPGTSITTTTTTYTTPQLVQDVFAAQSIFNISNISSSTGTNATPASENGIGYFNRNGSNFPFDQGIVLSTGAATDAPGPNTASLSSGSMEWGGDADLNLVMSTIAPGYQSKNATSLEFDFVPSVNNMSFNFLFASEEYGQFQCLFADAFAIILTSNAPGSTPQNLAVIPGTTTPISSTTVRNTVYNNSCPSVNPAFFAEYYPTNSVQGPINYNGRTVPFTAQATVIPGQSYHLKIVIADRIDPAMDSALFLDGGSFNIGQQLPQDLIIINSPGDYVACDENNDGFALFDLNSVTNGLFTGIDTPANYTVTYHETYADADANVNPVPNAYTNIVIISQALFIRIALATDPDTFIIEPVNLLVAPVPDVAALYPIAFCPVSPVDVTVKVEALPDFDQFGAVTYYTSQASAEAGAGALSQPEAYVATTASSIWVRVGSNNTYPDTPVCYNVVEQQLLPWHHFIYVDTPIDGSAASIVFLEGFDAFDYTITINGVPAAEPYSLEGLDYGDNGVSVTNTTCGGMVYNMFFVIWPAAPTGETTQTFTDGDTLADLSVQGQGIQWFTTLTGGNQLSMDTLLEDGATYYAGQYINNYISPMRLAVTTEQVAGLGNNSLAALKYYPNPVKDVVTLSNRTIITAVAIYNTLGQQLAVIPVNAFDAKINLAEFANGIYLIKVVAENGEKTIKIIKE